MTIFFDIHGVFEEVQIDRFLMFALVDVLSFGFFLSGVFAELNIVFSCCEKGNIALEFHFFQ